MHVEQCGSSMLNAEGLWAPILLAVQLTQSCCPSYKCLEMHNILLNKWISSTFKSYLEIFSSSHWRVQVPPKNKNLLSLIIQTHFVAGSSIWTTLYIKITDVYNWKCCICSEKQLKSVLWFFILDVYGLVALPDVYKLWTWNASEASIR